MSKRLINAARPVAKVKAGESCKNPECIGGRIDEYGTDGYYSNPCPTCSRLREIAEWCWHEWGLFKESPASCLDNSFDEFQCKHCSTTRYRQGTHHSNPTFTIPMLRELLSDLGELFQCLMEVWVKAVKLADENCSTPQGEFAKILQTPKLMEQAVCEYLETWRAG